MYPALLLPSHEALLARALPGIRAFLRMLQRVEMDVEEVTFFGLDLRSAAGATAGTQLLGQPWVEKHLAGDAFPIVVFPLLGRGDIITMVELLAPEVASQLGHRGHGSIDIIVVNEHGEGATLCMPILDVLDGAG